MQSGRPPSHPNRDISVSADDKNVTSKELSSPLPAILRSASLFNEVDDHATMQRLASNMSHHSGHMGAHRRRRSPEWNKVGSVREIGYDDPVLDPENPSFDAYVWAKKVLRAYQDAGFDFPESGFVFKNLSVSGSGPALQYQNTVSSFLFGPFRSIRSLRSREGKEKTILHSLDGVVRNSELLLVLGRPGAGCSTYLKSISGELNDLVLSDNSEVHYNGVPQKQMLKEFGGEIIYNQEVDKHFPQLSVGQTLEFAATCRTPQFRIENFSREEYIKHMAQVVMTIFGISHTYNTHVGNDFIRGVSGGERKRVSIAEMALSGARVGCWDNSTRGLDAQSAYDFVRALRLDTEFGGSCHAVAAYQASQAMYDVFDKVIVLYEGRQIYFGPCGEAERYFTEMGYENPPRQTTADFLTSVTNPTERRARTGMEKRVPRTPIEFERHWKASSQYQALLREISQSEDDHPVGGKTIEAYREAKAKEQADHVRAKSAYLISPAMQLRACMKRAYQRTVNDIAAPATTVIFQVIMGLIIASVFYGQGKDSTSSFFSKGAVLFFAVLFNALVAENEIYLMYDQRPIVEKHKSYRLYRPWAEALSGIIVDMPVKIVVAVAFNLVVYFLAELRTDSGSHFWIYFLFTYLSTIVMSVVFRTIASLTKTGSQAMAIAGVMILVLIIYTGFVVPPELMRPWFGWLRWLNPTFYVFEALMANEFHGREFDCAAFIPSYPDLSGNDFICSETGSVAGQSRVSGDAFILLSYGYRWSHVWRNLGIVFGFLIFFTILYVAAAEFNSNMSSTAEFPIFRRRHLPAHLKKVAESHADEDTSLSSDLAAETLPDSKETGPTLPAQKDVFTWRNVCYDIPVHDGERRLLNDVSGWVRPGTLTALMGVSGAGKTTLLDVLAKMQSIGVVTGGMFVNGSPLDMGFQRKTGYVQQQDLHVQTSTVREALQFSATLRQPKTVSMKEKNEHVENVIDMLGMRDYAEAVVGFPGSGLNVEQRKLLTIGVELAAKPELLLFLDEPTSGLDSQSSWAICSFLRKLADSGQAVLCTIHQPSAILFQEFDRLLLLAKGGKTVYFGNIGTQSRTLLDYFETNGARSCSSHENPAEYMLEIIGAGASAKSTQDWPSIWRNSPQALEVQTELDEMHEAKSAQKRDEAGPDQLGEFAMPLLDQLYHVTYRVFQQYWRTPSYIAGKFALGVVSAFFVSFSYYRPDSSQLGFQTILYAILMLLAIVSTMIQQIMPMFVSNRSLFEVRERPSKAYSWVAFLVANIFVEIPYQILLGIAMYATWYYPVFGAGESSERQGLILLFIIQSMVFSSSLAHLSIAALPDAETAGTIATTLFTLLFTFNGVLQQPSRLPGFWIFMYRANPITYIIAGIVGTGGHDLGINCSDNEFRVFQPPSPSTCGEYMATYLMTAPGRLENPQATQDCRYCTLSNSDQFLASSNIFWSERWRNYGIGFAFIGFNIVGAVLLYYMFRVRRFSVSKGVSALVASLGTVMMRFVRRRPEEKPLERKADRARVF